MLGFGKKDSSESGGQDAPGSIIKDKSSSFETVRSRASSYEAGKSDFRVFRDGKGAAVVARSDGRNFKDLARKAREVRRLRLLKVERKRADFGFPGAAAVAELTGES